MSDSIAGDTTDEVTQLAHRAAEAEALFYSLADGSLQGVAIHRGRHLLYVNLAYARILGYDDVATAYAGAKSDRHLLPEDVATLTDEWQRVLAGERIGDTRRQRRRRADGRLVWIDQAMQPITWQGAPAIQVVAVEVTREVEAQAELERGGDRFRTLAAGSLEGIVIHDGRRCLFANAAFAEMMGFADARAAMAQPDVAELVFPADRPAVIAEWRRVMEGERTWSRQREQRQRVDGTLIWIDTIRGPVMWFGRPAVQVIQIDVTREVEAAAELQRSEARIRAVLENLPSSLTLKGSDRRFRIVNPAFERWNGVSAGEAIGRTTDELSDWVPDGGAQARIVRNDDMAVLETGHALVRERQSRNAAGEVRDVIVTKFPVRDAAGKIDGIGTFVSDITELKQAQAQHHHREAELRRNQAAILALLREGASGGSLPGRIRRVLALAGETLGVDFVSLWRLDRETAAVRCLERWRVDNATIDPRFPMTVPVTPAFYSALEQDIVLALDRDRHPSALADMLATSYAGLGISACLTVLVQLPDGSVGHLGVTSCGAPRAWSTEDESFARSIAELIHIAFLQDALESRSRAQRRNHDTLVGLMRASLHAGSPREILDNVVRIACATLGIQRVALWSHLAIGEVSDCLSSWDAGAGRHLRLPEEEPAVSSATVRNWFTADYGERLSRDLVIAMDDVETDAAISPAGRIHFRRRGHGARMVAQVRLGDRDAGVLTFTAGPGAHSWSAEDRAFARSVADFVAFVLLAQHHRQALAALDLVSQGLYVEDARGEVIYANRVARRLAGAIDPAPQDRAVSVDAFPALPGDTPDGTDAGELIWHTPAGERLELGITRSALPDEGAITVIADITELKRREREREVLEAEMRQAAKLEAVGRLASGIAHDFNNLLGAILGFASFLQEDLPDDSAQHGYAARITRASEHAKEVVKQLLAFTRATDVERRTLDVATLVRDSAELLRASLPSSTRLMIDSSGDALPASVNSGQIHQILLNLCLNAHDALDGQPGTVTLSLTRSDAGRCEPLAPAPRDGIAFASSGHLRHDRAYARLTVTDDGTGMDAATVGRMFDPFFTTKSPSRGTGLGLAVVHAIVNAYDGAVTVESQPGAGTVFSIYLPLATDAPADDDPAKPAGHTHGSETVLLIDDEADLLEMMRIGLTRLGYAVTACPDPLAALALFERDPAAWDAVVTDQVMPRLKGVSLTAKLHALRPDCPIILCTGFNDGAVERDARQAGAGAFFLKPVEPHRIAETIRTLRDG